ncbi:MAG: hypothetical protein U0X76_10550 [Bacteroidia bacterium]
MYSFTSGSLSPFTGTKVFDSDSRNGGGGGAAMEMDALVRARRLRPHFENVRVHLNANSRLQNFRYLHWRWWFVLVQLFTETLRSLN